MKVQQNGKTMVLQKSEYMATIFDGHSHIERRVFVGEHGTRYVRINGYFARLLDLLMVNHFDVDTFYDGGGRF